MTWQILRANERAVTFVGYQSRQTVVLTHCARNLPHMKICRVFSHSECSSVLQDAGAEGVYATRLKLNADLYQPQDEYTNHVGKNFHSRSI